MTERTLREEIAHVMWLSQAERVATASVIQGRTLEAFAEASEETRREWLGYADAVLRLLDAHTAEQPAPESLMKANGNYGDPVSSSPDAVAAAQSNEIVRLQSAMLDALGRYQVTHIHEGLRIALAAKGPRP